METFLIKATAMKTDPLLESESLPTEIYFNIMSDIEFMQPYTKDPDIFNPESDKLKKFLIQSFCYLHPDFHYLSFLNSDDIDLEIIKAAGILQIFQTNNINKRYKLFDDMSKDDIHKFWLKFFSLFKKQDDFTADSIFNISWVNKINFFKDMTSTFNYLNYQFPIVNGNKFNDCIITKELDDWKELRDGIVITPDESVCHNSYENQVTEVDINNLITDLQQVVTMFSNKKLFNQDCELEHVDFFNTFINLTKNILYYKFNLIIFNSKFLDEYNYKLLGNTENMLENLYFIKRCNNIVKTLKSELKILT